MEHGKSRMKIDSQFTFNYLLEYDLERYYLNGFRQASTPCIAHHYNVLCFSTGKIASLDLQALVLSIYDISSDKDVLLLLFFFFD